MTQSKIKKYFEIPIAQSKWSFEEYFFFLIDSLYLTIFPFFLGYIVFQTKMWYLSLFLTLPIYVKFKIIGYERKTTKKLFIK